MRDRTPTPALTIFAGRFGSGKTEVAINYALLEARKGERRDGQPSSLRQVSPREVILIDLDIITPYFRSRERAESIRGLGVKVLAPSTIGQHLHTPAITPQILGAIEQTDKPVVIDVGGDKQGARALGQFSTAIKRKGYTMHFVVNAYRPFTDSLEGLASSIAEIEASARLQVTSLVSNPNLIGDTTESSILKGHALIEEFAQALGLPVAFVCIERHWSDMLDSNHFAQPTMILDRHFVMAWE